jgi:hypothetical protein
MFNNKLAQSIQRDYRQAADDHRMLKSIARKSYSLKTVRTIAAITILIITLSHFI